jgi:hypothetical protein
MLLITGIWLAADQLARGHLQNQMVEKPTSTPTATD